MKVLECRALFWSRISHGISEKDALASARKYCFRLSAIEYVEEVEITFYAKVPETGLESYEAGRKIKVPYIALSDKSAWHVIVGPSYEEIVALMRDA